MAWFVCLLSDAMICPGMVDDCMVWFGMQGLGFLTMRKPGTMTFSEKVSAMWAPWAASKEAWDHRGRTAIPLAVGQQGRKGANTCAFKSLHTINFNMMTYHGDVLDFHHTSVMCVGVLWVCTQSWGWLHHPIKTQMYMSVWVVHDKVCYVKLWQVMKGYDMLSKIKGSWHIIC